MRGPDGGLRGFSWWSHNLSHSEQVDTAEVVVDCDICHLVHPQIQMHSPSWTCPQVGLPSEVEGKQENSLLAIERKTLSIYGE